MKKIYFTHFLKHFPLNVLTLYINAQGPLLSNNIQPLLLHEMPVLIFSPDKCGRSQETVLKMI